MVKRVKESQSFPRQSVNDFTTSLEGVSRK